MKKRIAWTATLLFCAMLAWAGLKLFHFGLGLDTEPSPDGRFSIHVDQIVDPRHPILSLRDSDLANGDIRLVTQPSAAAPMRS